jgi:hypothetical protein
MNKLYKKYRIAGNWINVLLLLFVLVPLLALSYYNHPSPADDYCYIWTVYKIGWFEAMKLYYDTWTGRYFGILLNHSNPLLWHSVIGFKILPALLLLGIIYSLYSLFSHLTPTLSRLAHLGFAGVVFYLYVLKMPSVSEAFYWMAAFVTVTIPSILTLFWIVLVLRWYRQDTQFARISVGFLAGFFVFAIVGCGETNLLTIVLLVGAWWTYRILFSRKVDGFMLSMLAVLLVSAYLYFSADGNALRMAGNPLGGDLKFSITATCVKLASLTFNWVFKTPLLFFTLAWLVVLSRLSTGARNYFCVRPWFAVLLFVGILSAQLFASYYAIGKGVEPTPRVLNCVYFFFLIGWFYVTGVLFHYAQSRFNFVFHFNTIPYAVLNLLLVISVGFSVYTTSNIKVIYRDLVKGTASAYDKEMSERYRLILVSKEKVVYLPSIDHIPQSLFVEDIKSNSQHWWNRCMAGYFGKDAIYMTESKSEQK